MLHFVVTALQSSLVEDSFSVFACFHDLESLEEYGPHILSPKLGLTDVFLMVVIEF